MATGLPPKNTDLTQREPLSGPADIEGPRPAESVATENVPQSKKQLLAVRAKFSRSHAGPLPDAQYFRELAEIYPDAPRIILEDFREQAQHRRAIEKSVIETNSTLSRRAQIFGFTLGLGGLAGSFYVISIGHPTAGTAVAAGCVVSLVTVFVLGRESQKKERIAKAEIREKIKQDASIEKLEGDREAPDDDPSLLPSRPG